jgi:hypothetical protein
MRDRLPLVAFWVATTAFCFWFWWSLIGIVSSWFCCGVFA